VDFLNKISGSNSYGIIQTSIFIHFIYRYAQSSSNKNSNKCTHTHTMQLNENKIKDT